MNHIEKKRQLQEIIERELIPLVDSDYVLYGLPYYNNIGDTLIWNGELEFLKKVSHRCMGVCGWNSYPQTKLPENVTILITGGGYFGDVWRDGWQAVLDGIRPNRNNKIIILPNTIYYQDEAVRENDSIYLSSFPNLIICARDSVSFGYAKKYFSNPVLLVPDMAFCMSERLLSGWSSKNPARKALLFKRHDKECPDSDFNIPERDFDVSDWTTMDSRIKEERIFNRICRYVSQLGRIKRSLPLKAETFLYRHWYRRLMTRQGARQLSSYERIYTTRLHAMILGLLLGREIVMIDNSYGKLSSFRDTWLRDCENVTVF